MKGVLILSAIAISLLQHQASCQTLVKQPVEVPRMIYAVRVQRSPAPQWGYGGYDGGWGGGYGGGWGGGYGGDGYYGGGGWGGDNFSGSQSQSQAQSESFNIDTPFVDFSGSSSEASSSASSFGGGYGGWRR